jgi:hypothetical protein
VEVARTESRLIILLPHGQLLEPTVVETPTTYIASSNKDTLLSSIREPCEMPVHGRAIHAKRARDCAGVSPLSISLRACLACAGVSDGLRPSCTPRAFAAFNPALVRSTIRARAFLLHRLRRVHSWQLPAIDVGQPRVAASQESGKGRGQALSTDALENAACLS